MIQCVAIDDEKRALEVISLYVERVEHLELAATFTDPIAASSFLEQQAVDLLFLDINMKGLNGFELLETLTHKPQVIFTTAYSEYAVESYQVDALDYLVKPIPFSRFLKAINKLKSPAVPGLNAADSPGHEAVLSIKSGTTIHRVKARDILYLEADGNYCKYVTTTDTIMALGTLKEAMTRLGTGFMQVHRSFVVSLPHVDKVEVHQLHIAGHLIPVSSRYRQAVMSHFTS